MRTKLAATFATVVMAAGIVGGATFAYFSDTATNSDNTFAAGTLVFDDVTFASTEWDIPNAAPGDTGSATYTVTNNGSLDMKDVTVTITPDGALFAGSYPATLTYTLSDVGNDGVNNLAAGATETLTVNFNWTTSADNSYQGATGSATIDIAGVQAKNN